MNDAFGSAHRAHASTVGMIAYVPQAAAGLLMEQELKYLTMATRNPARPCVAILGGAKVSDKIEVIANLGKVVDKLLIGGAMAYTFLKAQGEPVGKSLVEDDKLDLARKLLYNLKDKLVLPVDHVVVSEIKENADSQVVETIPDGKIGVDIGPLTIDHYSHVIRTAKTVIWNGPMGVFEKKPFDRGTVALAKAVAVSGRHFGGGRRRFGKSHQVRGRGGPDFACLHRRRRIAGVSGRHRAAGRGRADGKVGARHLATFAAAARCYSSPSPCCRSKLYSFSDRPQNYRPSQSCPCPGPR